MRSVQIKDFSLSTTVDYERAVAYGDAKLEEVAKAFCAPPLATAVNTTTINLEKQNDLFSYSLFIPLFNGAGSATIDAQRINVLFKQGNERGHLDLMIDFTLKILAVASTRPTKQSLMSFTGHAVFDAPSDYAEYMKRFTSLSAGILSGGAVLVGALPEVDGELRYASEKSLAYENALFLAANGKTTKEVSKDLFESMGKRFEALAGADGISLRKA
jgi:hypothetical protein